MKQIPLTKGLFAVVDDDVFDYLSQFRWRLYRSSYKNVWYAGHKKLKAMHRYIMGVTDPKTQVDHINGDGLDNRRENLRLCTNEQNSYNRGPQKNNSTGYKGIYPRPGGKYIARISFNGQRKQVGAFATAEEAARARDELAIKYHGEFAWLNFPDERK